MRGLLLVLVASAAQAQIFVGSSTPTAQRLDSATSYTATGPDGFVFLPQPALGACDKVKVVWLAPSNELRLCDGSIWHQVWTSRDGVLPAAQRDIQVRSSTSNAPAGTDAFSVANAGAFVRLGPGENRCWGDGTVIHCGNLRVPDLTAGRLISDGELVLSSGAGWRFIPSSPPGVAEGTACTVVGKVYSLASTGRLIHCDGTTWSALTRRQDLSAAVSVGSLTLTAPSATTRGACTAPVLGATVAGVMDEGRPCVVGPPGMLPPGLRAEAWTTGVGTASLRFCAEFAMSPPTYSTLAPPLSAPAGTYRLACFKVP